MKWYTAMAGAGAAAVVATAPFGEGGDGDGDAAVDAGDVGTSAPITFVSDGPFEADDPILSIQDDSREVARIDTNGRLCANVTSTSTLDGAANGWMCFPPDVTARLFHVLAAQSPGTLRSTLVYFGERFDGGVADPVSP